MLDKIENTIIKNIVTAVIQCIAILSIVFVCFVIATRLGLNGF